MKKDVAGSAIGILSIGVVVVGGFLNWSRDIILTLQLIGLLFGGAASLVFVAPRIPYLEDYARPVEFETGWEKLLVMRSLNQSDPGFERVAQFLLSHKGLSDQIASDVGQSEPSGWEEEKQLINFIEEFRLMTRPTDFNESILICYDENTEGPVGEPKELPNRRYPLLNTDQSRDDWRWFASLSTIEHNASTEISRHVQNWLIYGGLFLGISAIINAIALFLQAN